MEDRSVRRTTSLTKTAGEPYHFHCASEYVDDRTGEVLRAEYNKVTEERQAEIVCFEKAVVHRGGGRTKPQRRRQEIEFNSASKRPQAVPSEEDSRQYGSPSFTNILRGFRQEESTARVNAKLNPRSVLNTRTVGDLEQSELRLRDLEEMLERKYTGDKEHRRRDVWENQTGGVSQGNEHEQSGYCDSDRTYIIATDSSAARRESPKQHCQSSDTFSTGKKKTQPKRGPSPPNEFERTLSTNYKRITGSDSGRKNGKPRIQNLNMTFTQQTQPGMTSDNENADTRASPNMPRKTRIISPQEEYLRQFPANKTFTLDIIEQSESSVDNEPARSTTERNKRAKERVVFSDSESPVRSIPVNNTHERKNVIKSPKGSSLKERTKEAVPGPSTASNRTATTPAVNKYQSTTSKSQTPLINSKSQPASINTPQPTAKPQPPLSKLQTTSTNRHEATPYRTSESTKSRAQLGNVDPKSLQLASEELQHINGLVELVLSRIQRSLAGDQTYSRPVAPESSNTAMLREELVRFRTKVIDKLQHLEGHIQVLLKVHKPG